MKFSDLFYWVMSRFDTHVSLDIINDAHSEDILRSANKILEAKNLPKWVRKEVESIAKHAKQIPNKP